MYNNPYTRRVDTKPKRASYDDGSESTRCELANNVAFSRDRSYVRVIGDSV